MGMKAASAMARCSILLFLLLLPSCGEKQTEYGPAGDVRVYLDELKDILQQLRSLEQQIGRAVPADTVAIEVIAPLIQTRFRPALTDLRDRALQLQAGAALDSVHQQLLSYLELRIRAFDLVLEGVRQERPELFDEFTRLQIEADRTGRGLEKAILKIRQSLN